MVHMVAGEADGALTPEAVLQLERLQARDGADRRQRGAGEVIAARQVQAGQPRQPRQPLRMGTPVRCCPVRVAASCGGAFGEGQITTVIDITKTDAQASASPLSSLKGPGRTMP